VLTFVNTYPSDAHPAQGAFVREQARAAALVADVAVLCNDGPLRGLPERHRIEEERRGGLRTLRLSYRRPPGRLPHLGYRTGIREALGRLRAAGFEPDLIHAHFFIAGATAVRMGRRLGVPVVISEHSSRFADGTLRGRDLRRARWALGSAAVVCPVSRYLSDLIERAGVEARLRVVPNAVDAEVFAPGPRRPLSGDGVVLAYAGHLIPGKGLDHLLNALAGAGLPGAWRLRIAGEGHARGPLERLADELGLSEHVEFAGALPKPRLAELLRGADLFVLPSLGETQGVVLIEAMACGLPVLATDAGGVRETVPGDAGVLVAPGDPDALRAGLTRALAMLERFDREAIAQQTRRRFGYPAVAGLWREVYEDVLARGRREDA
jgi:L-malate glycosyltransferase